MLKVQVKGDFYFLTELDIRQSAATGSKTYLRICGVNKQV